MQELICICVCAFCNILTCMYLIHLLHLPHFSPPLWNIDPRCSMLRLIDLFKRAFWFYIQDGPSGHTPEFSEMWWPRDIFSVERHVQLQHQDISQEDKRSRSYYFPMWIQSSYSDEVQLFPWQLKMPPDLWYPWQTHLPYCKNKKNFFILIPFSITFLRLFVLFLIIYI